MCLEDCIQKLSSDLFSGESSGWCSYLDIDDSKLFSAASSDASSDPSSAASSAASSGLYSNGTNMSSDLSSAASPDGTNMSPDGTNMSSDVSDVCSDAADPSTVFVGSSCFLEFPSPDFLGMSLIVRYMITCLGVFCSKRPAKKMKTIPKQKSNG
ncbi:uncharacterized protein NDAI_0E03150 [Naumovozyma dairenensis CBS 421]|uniref:Uncharacterized protein n=1 Tax=Naumovozyma dairenensis (strain ATCC 10597 / BCRC 20456 / CBS 421 / NBRC 0211 / NRRL Y-12639) TaxID=1071378 RepID=G0WBL2_NAUDC|nr:hypothetical protein NDAI_0E03150 [Naumovozyma dairenensis CBS 421]CCD25132.1 hypothetical protein NDAI_0E03150 [Naumovozyma dairenensis CBS 421]